MRGKGNKLRLSRADDAVMAQTRATQNLLKDAGKRLRRVCSDADEPREMVEEYGFSVTREDGILAEPTECLGFACPMRADDCGMCPLSAGAVADDGDERALFIERTKEPFPNSPPLARQRRGEWHYLFSSAPRERGSHATAALASVQRARTI